jgi:hypothetical protein
MAARRGQMNSKEEETPYLESDILTNDRQPFQSKGACVIAITRAKKQTTHEPIRVPNGFIGRVVEEQDKKVVPPLECNILCRVTRSNIDADNANMVISVCVNDRKNKRTFMPGQEVALSKAHIDALRNSAEETRLTISPDSGIYLAANPLQLARNQYPGMQPEYDVNTGAIVMVQRTPNFIVEEIRKIEEAPAVQATA